MESAKAASQAPGTRPARKQLGISVRHDSSDHMAVLTAFVAAGLLLAAVFAVFGLPESHLPMPTWSFGVVTPTCGLTRACTALARGEFAVAWRFNPASYLLALLAVATVIRWIAGRVTGRWVNISVRPTATGWIAVVVLIALWSINQQAHAELIMTGRV